HKQLYAPMGVGVLLFNDPDGPSAIEHSADYAVRSGSMDLGRRSLEGSRPGVALLLHAALHLLGRNGYECAVNTTLSRSRYMATKIRSDPAFELLTEPQLNVVLYRYLPQGFRPRRVERALDDWAELDRINEAIHKIQRTRGHAVVSRTIWRPAAETSGGGHVALRAVLANPMTTPMDIDAVLEEQASLGAALSRQDTRAP
ncbi:MAG: putative pyridoxal-dependent aspartate 1-decarboxylase, partial [Actinobacteria bacterium]|nr:putative pyridoxal-dependent aspartate 1-decarboxylase [Actinomycetota bacterium]